MSAPSGTVVGLGKGRVEALSDGIFAAVLTILGLSLTLPFILGPVNQPLPDFTEALAGVLIYALSFLTIAVFWVSHHIAFHYVRRMDRTYIWINNVFLLFVGLLPLSTVLLGRHPLERVPLVVYGLNLLAAQSLLYLSFWYSTKHYHLIDADLDTAIIRSGRRRILLGPLLSVSAILLSLVNPLIGLGVYTIFPALFALPGRIDAFWQRQEIQ